MRKIILERFDMSLGAGLGKLAGRVFRIGHLGDFNDLMLMGTLCGVEMGLRIARRAGGGQRRGGRHGAARGIRWRGFPCEFASRTSRGDALSARLKACGSWSSRR